MNVENIYKRRKHTLCTANESETHDKYNINHLIHYMLQAEYRSESTKYHKQNPFKQSSK